MSLELNLGDVVFDTFFNNNIIIVARKEEDGTPVILPGYEDVAEVHRALTYVSEPEGRAAIVLENFGGFNKPGDGYYTFVGDDELSEVTR